MKIKKMLSILLAVVLILSMSVSALAQTAPYDHFSYNELRNTNGTVVITDASELARIAIEDDCEIPAGYYLEKVEISVQDDPSLVISPISPKATYTISNVTSTTGLYYPDQYEEDFFQGAADISQSYSSSETAEFTAETGVSSSVVNAKLGIKIGNTKTVTKTFSTSVADGKTLRLRVYTNYKVWNFDVNKSGTYIGSEEAWSPIGLIFKQYTFATI